MWSFDVLTYFSSDELMHERDVRNRSLAPSLVVDASSVV